jgi:hypothetical protein
MWDIQFFPEIDALAKFPEPLAQEGGIFTLGVNFGKKLNHRLAPEAGTPARV